MMKKSTRHFYHDTDFTLENFERQPPAPETVNNDTSKQTMKFLKKL